MHKDFGCAFVSKYFRHGQDDQVECDEVDRPRKEEEKILSSGTVIVAIITLLQQFVYIYVSGQLHACHNLGIMCVDNQSVENVLKDLLP